MTSRRLGQRRRQASQDAMQIEPGEAPLEWRGDGAVVLPEGEEPGLELGERGEVVGVEHLALDDREVDLRLVQPTRMHGRMDDADRWPALAQAGLAPRALVGGAVVTQKTRRALAYGSWRMTCSTSRPKGAIPVRGSQRPNTCARWTSQAAK